MAAIVRNKNPYLDPNRSLDLKTLRECGNDIRINQRIILKGGRPTNPNFYAETTAVNTSVPGLNYVTVNSNENLLKNLAPGDNVVLWSKEHENKSISARTKVYTISGNIIVFRDDIGNLRQIPGTMMIGKEIIIRVSDRMVYMIDEWGDRQPFFPVAETASIEASMGEMYDDGWDRSEFEFSIANYGGFFDKYLPGGTAEENFQGKEVEVYFGVGETRNQNVLVFKGFTHVNDGFGESDKKLSLSAYDISYKYNQPITLGTFANTILDEDMRNEPIPNLYGNYQTTGKTVGNRNRPIIQATLLSYVVSNIRARATILKSDTNGVDNFVIASNTSHNTMNDYKFIINLNTEVKPGSMTAASCLSTAVVSGKTHFTVNLYQGTSTTFAGVPFNSTTWLYLVLQTNSTFTTNFFAVGNTTAIMPDYTAPVPPNYKQILKTITVTTSGGSITANAEYQICGNPINPDQTGSSTWYTQDYDDPGKWETQSDYIGGSAVTPVWDWQQGKVRIQGIPVALVTADGQGKLPLVNYKLFAFVKGEELTATTFPNDAKVLLNVGYSEKWGYTDQSAYGTRSSFSGRGSYSTSLGTNIGLTSSFQLGRSLEITPMYLKYTPGKSRVCYTSWGGLYKECYETIVPKHTPNYSTLRYLFKNVAINNSTDFVYDMEFNDRSTSVYTSPFNNVYVVPASGTLLAFQSKTTGEYVNKMLLKIDRVTRKLIVSINGNDTIGSDHAVSQDHNYRVRVKKQSNLIYIQLKDLDAAGPWETVALSAQPTFTSNDNFNLHRIIVGSDTIYEATLDANHMRLQIGTLRFSNNQNAFTHEDFVSYQEPYNYTDIVSIARRLLKLGGVDDTLLDDSWDQLAKSKIASSYDARLYINEVDLFSVDAANKLLSQIGFKLSMRAVDNEMKFTIIPDTTEFYRFGDIRVNEYDIVNGSVNISREVNQYFNTARASYNQMPGEDDLINVSNPYVEPNALKRDAFIYYWFKIKRDDVKKDTIELPNLYQTSDITNVLKERIANSTPGTEMIEITLTWRHLFLQLGDFVTLNYDRYTNVPCQVRSINIDASGSRITVKLRSLQKLQFTDFLTGVQYTPTNYTSNPIGGDTGKTNIVLV